MMKPEQKDTLDQQKTLLLLALSFFTRVPVTFSQEISAAQLNKASRYFAVVGLFVGLCSALMYMIASAYLPKSIAVLLAMAASLLLTGAFHEDGWADTWDGFGGGWSKAQKLDIMKDSRLGTYGASALIIILLLKYQALVALVSPVMALIVANTLSRVVATSLIYDMSYVALDEQSKVKPLAQALSKHSLLILLFTGLTVSFFFLPLIDCILLFIILIAFRAILRFWFNAQLGGYTGDCLGAAQQSSEIVIYLSLLLLGYGELGLTTTLGEIS